MCETCAELLHLINAYDSDVNANFGEFEADNDPDSSPIRPLSCNEVNVLCNYLHYWQQRHCNCIFKDLKNFDKLNLLIQGLLVTCLSLLKHIVSSFEPNKGSFKESTDGDSESHSEDRPLDYKLQEFSKWTVQDKEKLLHLVSKTFHVHFPLYAVHKHNMQSRLEDLTQREAALLSTFCDPSDSEIPVLLLKNVSFFCEHEAIGLLVDCFAKAAPDTLSLGLAHAIIAVISNLKYVINVNNLIPRLVLLRTCVINYLCKIPDKDLRIPSNRNMFEFMWSVIKDPLDPRSVIDKEGLALALKYFTSSTLTMRLAGIAQINNYISLFNEFCQSENGVSSRQADGEELVEWILSNKIVEHIFGPNLHVEVIKQSQVVLNFIVTHITPDHIDVIWSASHLKHCSRQVFDIMTPLIKNMSVGSVLHLYSLIRKLEPKDHTEQTLILASCLLRFIWTKSLNIPEPSSLKGACNTLEELAIVKSPIFTLLPGSSSVRRHDSSTSASVDGSDEEDEDDFDIVSQKLLSGPQIDPRMVSADSGSSCGTQSSSDEIQDSKNSADVIVPSFGCKVGLRPNNLKNSNSGRGRQKYPRKMDSAPTDSDEDNSGSNKHYAKLLRKKQKYRGKNKDMTKAKGANGVVNEEIADNVNRIVHAVLNDQANETICNTEGEDIASDSNTNSSQVSQSSQKNMADFDGEESASGCETELIQLSATATTEKSSAAHHLASMACIHAQQFRGQPAKATKDNENVHLELSKFTIESVCKPGQTVLWDLLQDSAVGQLAEGLAHECEKVLCNLICWLADRRIRMKFIEGCLENLSQNRSVIISLRLLPKLLMSFQQYRGGMDTHSITLWADSERHMLRHFFANLVLYTEKRQNGPTEHRTHVEETQTRLHFLSFVFSFAGSPESFRLNREQVDTLWSCIASDLDCRDELFNWMLNQVRIRDQHALDNDMFHYILLEKMPQLAPENFSMLALELLHYLCGIALSTSQNGEVVSVAIKQLWDIALRAVNTDVSMSAIKHLNNYYIHLQHPVSALDKEEEFIKQCMDYLNLSSTLLHDDEEKHLTIIQRALILLKTHLEAFRCRYSFHLRLLQLNGDISIVSHLNKSCERSGLVLKIVCQPAAFNDRNTFEMNSSDFVGELRAEVTFWWKQLVNRYKSESANPKHQNLPVDGPLRLLSQGQELTQDLDEKTLSEVGFKDMQLVYVSVGANRPSRKMRDSIEPASSLPPPCKDRLPSILLLQPVYFEQLFNLVQQLGSMKSSSTTRAQVLSRRVWEIIHILPTSPDLLRCFQSISSDNEESESPSTTKQGISKLFNSLLSPSSPQKLIYSVQIVEWLQTVSKNEENGWSQKFVDSGGLQHLFEIFVSGVLQQGESDSWNEWKQDCLACLLQLIYQFGISHHGNDQRAEKNGSGSTNQSEATSRKKRNRKGSSDKLIVYQFNSNLLGMLNDVESMLRVLLTVLSETTSVPADVNSYQTGFWCRAQVVHHTLNFLTSWAFSDPQIRIALFKYPNVSSLLKKLVLDDPDPAVRREACTGFYRMCLGVTNTKKSGLIFIPQLLNALLSFLPVAQSMRPPKAPENDEIAFIEKEPFGPGCKDYFWLVCRLVDSLDNSITLETTVDLDHWSHYLGDTVEKREIRESRHSIIEDEGLRGLLCLMTVILKHNPPFKTSSNGRKFLTTVFELLFLAPNQKEKHLPKCKMQSTRSAAFDLLVELAKGCEENHIALMKLLCEQHDPNSHSPYPWDYWPHDDCRSECGYVGLINLGATCYMASCVQHLFMLPEARLAILSAKISNDTKHGAVLHELQKMFAFLLESERKAYNPKNFCKVYTMDNQPLNTGEQKDMTEFFTDLISKLEEMVPMLKEILKSLFSGTLSNNVVSLDCPHISRTTEEFYTLRCKVADMRHLWDSLDELTVKDTLEGDNMYTCSQCGRKVRAEKRACIKKLPRVLCFNTMRYTFNMVTMTKEKVNTHFSFPLRLDMSPYLEKNLIPGALDDEGTSALSKDEESSDYELIGVTVHTGTADGGHYYSFIREPNALKGKDKWYMFNDAEVKLFDPSQLAAECFGGEMTSKTYDSVTDKFMDFSIEKTNSAYMLFYERIPKSSTSKEEQETPEKLCDQETVAELAQDLSEWIWEDNMQFLRDKSIFEHTYFDFMWQVCAYIPQTLNNSNKIVTLSAQLATSFVLETLIHSKEKPTIANWIELLTKQFNGSAESCEWLIDHLAENYLQWPVQILLKCPNQMVRQLFQRLCIHVISQLRTSQLSLYLLPAATQKRENSEPLPDIGNCSCITRFVRKLLLLIKCNNVVVKPHLKHLTEYFTFLYEFAKLGDEECVFLIKVESVALIVQFYLSHCKSGSDYVEVMSEDDDEEDESMGHHGFRGPYSHLQINLQEKYPKPASLDKMIMFVAYLVEKSRTLSVDQFPSNEPDLESIFGGKAFPFIHRQIRDNINLRQSFQLIVSLCRSNEVAAASIVNMILNAINRQPDVSQPFFRILSMLVEHANEPAGIPLFSSFIYPRIWEIAEQNPHHCLEWLTAQVPRSKNAHNLVLRHLDTWVEYFLLAHSNQRVRNAAALLLISLVPNNIFRQSYYKSPRTLIMQHKDGLELNNEAVVIIQQIFSCLLQLLKNAKQYVDPQTHGTTKLTSYFAVMVYCLVSRNEKLMFTPFFMDLWNLFQPKLSEPAIPVNQNKQTLLYFWYQACIDCPENVRCIVQNTHVTRNIAFNYILADHDDQEVMLFNRVMLPSYYGLLRLCCTQSRTFTRHLALHQNIQWAFKNITPYFTQYQAAVGELFKLMKLFATIYPDSTEQEIRDVKQFKRTTLQMYLTSIDPRSYWTTLISVYTILVETEEDKAFVILNNAIIALFQSFHTLYMMFHEATACHVTNEIVDLLKVITDLLRVIKNSTQAEVREWAHKWKDHGEVIRKLIYLLNTYTPSDVRNVCTSVLLELIQIYPKDCVPVLVQGLGLGHLTFQDQYLNFSAGPFFPRRGQRAVLAKSSLRPQRPVFQMHFHAKMLEVNLGTEEEYDKAVIEYYYPYYKFIASICKIAVANNLVNQELVGFCSMVALECLPMHLPIFPQLWLEFIRSSDKGAKEFITVLYSSCNYFREYVTSILTNEQSFLDEDCVFEFLKECLPKVSSLVINQDVISKMLAVVNSLKEQIYNLDISKEDCHLIGELRALLLVFSCEVPPGLTTDLRTVFSKLKGRCATTEEGLSETVETPQKKRKTKEELSVGGSEDGSHQENEDVVDHWKQRLDNIVSELVRILEIS